MIFLAVVLTFLEKNSANLQMLLRHFVLHKCARPRQAIPLITGVIIHLKCRQKRIKRKENNVTVSKELRRYLSNIVHHAKHDCFPSTLVNVLRNDPVKFWHYISDTKKFIDQINVSGVTVGDKEYQII